MICVQSLHANNSEVPILTEYIFLIVAVLTGFYALTYARWLHRGGNRTGAIGVLVIVLLSVALPAYRLLAR